MKERCAASVEGCGERKEKKYIIINVAWELASVCKL